MASFPPMADKLREKKFKYSKSVERTNLLVFYLIINYLYVVQLAIISLSMISFSDIRVFIFVPITLFYVFFIYKIDKFSNIARLLMIVLILIVLSFNLIEFLNVMNIGQFTNSEFGLPIFNSLIPLFSLYVLGLHQNTIKLFQKKD